MKLLIPFLAVVVLVLGAVAAAWAAQERVAVCHITSEQPFPGGTALLGHVIEVAEPGAEALADNGDWIFSFSLDEVPVSVGNDCEVDIDDLGECLIVKVVDDNGLVVQDVGCTNSFEF